MKVGDLIRWTPMYKAKHVAKPYYFGLFIRWAPEATWKSKSGDAFQVLCEGKIFCWDAMNTEVVSEGR